MRYLISILVFLALVGALVAVKVSQIGVVMNAAQAAKQSGPPPETVSSAAVKKTTWATTLTAIGSIEAAKGVTLSSDLAGIVTRIAFESGDAVTPGQILLELDTRVERAQLDSARARRDLAETTLSRTRNLVEGRVATVAELDAAAATHKTSAAEVAALEAQIARKTVRAPFAGRLGIRMVNVGQYLAPGSAVTTLQSQQDDYVDFTLPQQHLDVLRVGLPIRIRDDAAGIDLGGVLAAIAPAVDQTTRSVALRASVADPGKRLRPGMFVNVAVELAEEREVVVVPTTALVHAPYGDSLFIVEDRGAEDRAPRQVRQQFVRLGERRGDFVEVTKGLTGAELVVAAGAFKLRNGARVVIDDESVELEPKLHPDPPDR